MQSSSVMCFGYNMIWREREKGSKSMCYMSSRALYGKDFRKSSLANHFTFWSYILPTEDSPVYSVYSVCVQSMHWGSDSIMDTLQSSLYYVVHLIAEKMMMNTLLMHYESHRDTQRN